MSSRTLTRAERRHAKQAATQKRSGPNSNDQGLPAMKNHAASSPKAPEVSAPLTAGISSGLAGIPGWPGNPSERSRTPAKAAPEESAATFPCQIFGTTQNNCEVLSLELKPSAHPNFSEAANPCLQGLGKPRSAEGETSIHRIADLPPADRDAIVERIDRGMTYPEAADFIRATFGICPAPTTTAIAMFYKREKARRAIARYREAASQAEAPVGVVRAHPAPFREALLGQLGQEVFRMLVRGQTEPAALAKYTELLLRIQREQRSDRLLELQEKKFAFAMRAKIQAGLDALRDELRHDPEAESVFERLSILVARHVQSAADSDTREFFQQENDGSSPENGPAPEFDLELAHALDMDIEDRHGLSLQEESE